MEISRFVVFGHSHVWSVRRAVATLKLNGQQLEVVAPLCGTREMPGPVVLRDVEGKFHLTSTLSALLTATSERPDAASTCLVSMVQGNHYNQLGMVATGGGFDFVLPWLPELPLDDTVTVLPYMAVRAMLLTRMAEIPDFIRIMGRTSFAERTIIAGAPPPEHDDKLIRELSRKEGVTDPPNAPHVRLKLWHLQNQVYSDLCEGTQLTYLPGTPEGTQDEEGFLRPEFVKDAVHANADWAERYLSLVKAAATMFKEKSSA